jgi:hypothetical protein
LTGVGLSTFIFKRIAVGKWMLLGYSMTCLILMMLSMLPTGLFFAAAYFFMD